jgi:hypothetical protein
MDGKRGVFGAYVVLAASTTLYALLLNSARGKRFATEYTWASVSIGTAIVLICTRFVVPESAWRKTVLAFIIGGLPLIGRSVINRAG